MPNLVLRDLEAIALVAERRSFRVAAQELGMSPSALSYVVSSVEARLGVQLLNRTTRSVSPTDAGLNFFSQLRPALNGITDALRTVDGYRTVPAGRVRINASERAAERLLPTLLAFMVAFPEIRIDIATDDRLLDIIAAGFDAGIRLAESVPQDMVALPLWPTSALILVGSPDYFDRRAAPLEPADLQEHECIRSMFPSGRILDWELVHNGIALNVDITGRLVVGNVPLARQAALAGAGIAYVDEWSARNDLADGRLVQVLHRWTPQFSGICLYYPKNGQQSAAFRALVEFLRNPSNLPS